MGFRCSICFTAIARFFSDFLVFTDVFRRPILSGAAAGLCDVSKTGAAMVAGTGSGKAATTAGVGARVVAFGTWTGSGNAATPAGVGVTLVAFGTGTGSAKAATPAGVGAMVVALGTGTGSGKTATTAGAGATFVSFGTGIGSGKVAMTAGVGATVVAFGTGTGSGKAAMPAGVGATLVAFGAAGWKWSLDRDDSKVGPCGDVGCTLTEVASATMSVLVAQGARWSNKDRIPLALAITPIAITTRPIRTMRMNLAAGSNRPHSSLRILV